MSRIRMSASAVVAAAFTAAPVLAQDACSALAAPELFSHTTVTSAMSLAADAETGAPAHCAVEATLSPVEGSTIGVVYRLPPPEEWNGKLLGLGGGGWAGNVRLATAIEGLERGYATLQTDGGHAAVSPFETTWAADAEGRANMVAIEDFGHRAVHEMTARGKDIAAAYYGRAHDLAYWQGCSTGGRQGLMEVQRYPGDYDGVIAGAPVYDLMTQMNGWARARNFSAPERKLAPSHPALIAAAVLDACDAADGAEDGIVQDPRACDWDPAALACGADAADDSACLTPD